LVRNEAAPRFFSAAFSCSSSADRRVASRTRAAAAFAATRGSKPEPDVFSLSLGREDSFSFFSDSFSFSEANADGRHAVRGESRRARRISLGLGRLAVFPAVS
jgi:hypothetical protein